MKNDSKMYNSNKLNLLISTFILLAINLGCNFSYGTGDFAKPDMPSTEQQNVLVKQTLKDFAKGIESSDFSILMSNASKELQSAASGDKMKNSFQSMIDDKRVLVPIMQSADSKTPQFTTPPSIEKEGDYYLMEYRGNFPTDRAKTYFEFKYFWQESKWKLVKIGVFYDPDKDKQSQ
jgi:hypothetical protein